MKKLSTLMVAGLLMINLAILPASAQSLDEVIGGDNGGQAVVQQDAGTAGNNYGGLSDVFPGTGTGAAGNQDYVNEMKDATDLSDPSPGASAVNQGIKKVASFIIQILSYAVTALLVVRVMLDLTYILLPFTRSFLSNGFQGNAQAGAGGGPGMGGMGGMGGPGMGGGMMGAGMGGGFGGGMMNRGMGGGMMGGGMMGGGMGGMAQQPQGIKIQWVSQAALNAAAAETVQGPDGKAVGPLKVYAKDMMVTLIAAPIFLVLAVTGVLTNLGFLLGELIASGISSIGNML